MQAYDSQGEKIWDCELDIYGKVRNIAGGKCFVPFRYQGQYEDEETGLYYNRFRYYSPESGTYISQDPIGLAGNNPNTYAYVKDVHTWVDVFGLYRGEGIRGLGKYNSFFDADLSKNLWNASDQKHFREANKQLYEAIEASPKLKKTIQTKYPGVVEHTQPGPKGGFKTDSPPGMTWHHNNKPGRLELVDRADHNTFHKIYHPDGSGGKKKWGGGRNIKFKQIKCS